MGSFGTGRASLSRLSDTAQLPGARLILWTIDPGLRVYGAAKGSSRAHVRAGRADGRASGCGVAAYTIGVIESPRPV